MCKAKENIELPKVNLIEGLIHKIEKEGRTGLIILVLFGLVI